MSALNWRGGYAVPPPAAAAPIATRMVQIQIRIWCVPERRPSPMQIDQ
jgi:hypothetical protein